MMEMMQHFRSAPIRLGEFSATPESELPQRIQVLRCGTFHHPEYGTFVVTPSILAAMKLNFDKKVRGTDLAVDYGHNSDKEAAGWIQALHLSDDGQELWAEMLWTPEGKRSLINREYRYVSADFTTEYQDHESLVKFGPVLFGAGLTNRPFVKNMAPAIELSEGKGDPKMTDQEKKAAEDAAAAAAAAAQPNPEVKKAAEDDKAPEAPAAEGETTPKSPEQQKLEDVEKMCSDLKAQLEAKDAELGALKKQLEDKELAAQKTAEEKALAEKNLGFNKLLSEGKAVEAQREAFIAGDMIKFAEHAAPVKLKTEGSGEDKPAPKKGDDNSASGQVVKLAEGKLASNEAKTLGEAISMVLREKPDMAKAYREETQATK